MRRRAAAILLSFTLTGFTAAAAPSHEPARESHASPRQTLIVPSRPAGPPHAWLFGTWTGGLFPVLDGMLAQDCRTQPTVGFAQDVVGHTSLTTPGMTRRVIETVRTTPSGAEFRFTPEPGDLSSFGCEDTNALHVLRESSDQISFPHCAAFPYPLQRCPVPGR